ncbi:MAG: hypothetical protein JST26_16050 [Bacteroidetes bacterium]|nr:hypothetical protein [Bacteroidota bacterium]
MKYLLIIFSLFMLATAPLKAQFSESKERKRLWGHFHRKQRDAYNPYLHKKTKPSAELANQNKRDIRRGNRAAKKQAKRSMKKLGIKPTKIKRP